MARKRTAQMYVIGTLLVRNGIHARGKVAKVVDINQKYRSRMFKICKLSSVATPLSSVYGPSLFYFDGFNSPPSFIANADADVFGNSAKAWYDPANWPKGKSPKACGHIKLNSGIGQDACQLTVSVIPALTGVLSIF